LRKGLNDSYQSGRERREKLISSQDLAEKIQFEPKYKNEIEKFFGYLSINA